MRRRTIPRAQVLHHLLIDHVVKGGFHVPQPPERDAIAVYEAQRLGLVGPRLVAAVARNLRFVRVIMS